MTELIYRFTNPEEACIFLQMCDGELDVDRELNLGSEEVTDF